MPAQNDSITVWLLFYRSLKHHAQFKARSLPWEPYEFVSVKPIELFHLLVTVRSGSQRNGAVRMQMIHMREGKKSVQWRINRSSDRIQSIRAEWVILDHLIFALHASVKLFKRAQLVKIEARKT